MEKERGGVSILGRRIEAGRLGDAGCVLLMGGIVAVVLGLDTVGVVMAVAGLGLMSGATILERN